ncbi:uncharacterized protein LOC109722134 [Ananas comosus]|uniref:Uncharacterized protein LOC109722134 n=1 Tax=Ananas comosus TaxID=4615 RepID=A0A6P5GBW8_ANACO|nr:uncharacterized protein LOC109722134 [Ananas comosus]
MAREGYRSKSYADGRMQVVPYGLRSYSSSSSRGYFSSYEYQYEYGYEYDPRASKGMEVYGGKQPSLPSKPSSSSSSSNRSKNKDGGGGGGGGWVFGDPEFQRKKRVASYKAYSAEGKLKRSFGRSFRWLKDRYNDAVYGWW